MSAPTDAELISAIGRGDEHALTALHDRHAVAAFRFVHRMLDDVGEAEDVVVETFYDVWRVAGRFEARASVRTWLFGIARHKALDRLRARGRLATDPLDEEEGPEIADETTPSPFERLLARETSQRLSDCVDALPDAQREAFWLHVVDGLKLRELSEVLTIPENTAATRVHHAKRRLRDCLERGA
jgi:RNA polymerase sigma-70 factor (ECF subfamily)